MELASLVQNVGEFIRQPWHWAVSGAAIATIVLIMTLLGKNFGVSGSFKALCSAAGAGKKIPFFNMDLKTEDWRFAFVIGGILGGLIGATLLQSPEPVAISSATQAHLAEWGMPYAQSVEENPGFIPTSLFNFGNMLGLILAIIGGFLVGFGARYADGCTSGHAISGLAHLKLPSLIAVIGFFIGGLIMTHLIMPLIFG